MPPHEIFIAESGAMTLYEDGISPGVKVLNNGFKGLFKRLITKESISVVHFENQTYQTFWIDLGSTISILNIDETGVHYILNNIPINAKEY